MFGRHLAAFLTNQAEVSPLSGLEPGAGTVIVQRMKQLEQQRCRTVGSGEFGYSFAGKIPDPNTDRIARIIPDTPAIATAITGPGLPGDTHGARTFSGRGGQVGAIGEYEDVAEHLRRAFTDHRNTGAHTVIR